MSNSPGANDSAQAALSKNTIRPSSATLTRGSIPAHLVSQTMPMVIGVAAMMSIGLVDAFFVGQLGSVELAAISFIFPVAVALSSLGIGVMVGINSVVARAIGEGDDEKAQRRANFGMLFALAAGIIMGLSLIALLDPIFALMNAPAEVLPLIRDYMIPFALGFPLTMMTMGFNGVLRAQGEARKASYISLTFAGANWILDPILITGAFGFAGFGISGAAYATIIGWAIGVTLALYLLRSTSIPFDPKRLKGVRPFESMSAILRVGVPAACANAINPLGLTILTALAANEGQAAVAGFGAAGRLQSFAVVPLLALSGSIGAIVGQNWGAERYDRAREAALYAGGFCVVWGLGIAIAMISAGEWFADFFTEDPAVIAEFALYLQIAAWGYAGFGLLIVANGILNAVDKAMFALLQSFARVFLVMLPIAWMLQADWGSPAIYSAELAANLFGAVTAILIVGIVLRTNSAVYQRMPGG